MTENTIPAATTLPAQAPAGWRGHLLAAWRNMRGLLLFLVLMSLFRSAIADHMRVPTGSMNPTVIEGDQIVVNKMAYGLRIPFTHVWLYQGAGPQRGDIITFDSPQDGDTWLKRVIGLPGDTVEMRDEEVFINGKPLAYKAGDASMAAHMTDRTRQFHLEFADEQLGKVDHPIMLLPQVRALRSFGPVTVPAGQYWLMGDNRDNSEDSRYIGTIERRRITGHADAILLSLDEEHHFKPRTDRFIKKLN